MDDLISRQAAIANAISGLTREFEGEKWIRVSEVRESLKTMPSTEHEERNYLSTVYVEEVVRCADCKYGDTGTDEDGRRFYKCIGIHYGGVSPTDYCSYGERKDG